MVRVTLATRNSDINNVDYTQVFLVTSKPVSLLLQPLTHCKAAFAELRYGRRDFQKEGRKTEKGKVGRVAEGEVGG